MQKIRVGIIGYGNLGRGVEQGLKQNQDMELVAVFTRRNPETIKTYGAQVKSMDVLKDYVGKIDILILCGGSATDLPTQAPEMLKMFNTVDSFDTHACVPQFFEKMDKVGKEYSHLAGISIGWDPGLFSLARACFEGMAPEGFTTTFWGKGVSQGHSDAIRRIEGVENAIQYTIPLEEAVEKVRNGEGVTLSTKEKHLRECFVVAMEGADLEKIESEIKNMPNYFADYDTIVNFISADELKANHSKMPHGGRVIRSAKSSLGSKCSLELAIKLESNPEFTSSVLISYARAVSRLNAEGKTGAVTVVDVAPKYLMQRPYEEILKTLI